MEPYKERMLDEYYDLSSRIEKLERIIDLNSNGLLTFRLNTPMSILQKQLYFMNEYKKILEIRAEIEGVPV